MRDWYEVLQVSPNAEPEVIGAAYLRLSRKYHPDVDPSAAAAEHQRLLNEAYEVLVDPARRSAFDKQRRRPPPSSGPRGAEDQGPGAGPFGTTGGNPGRPSPAPKSAGPEAHQRGPWRTLGIVLGLIVAVGIILAILPPRGDDPPNSPVGVTGFERSETAGPSTSATPGVFAAEPQAPDGQVVVGRDGAVLALKGGETRAIPFSAVKPTNLCCACGTYQITWVVSDPPDVRPDAIEIFTNPMGQRSTRGTSNSGAAGGSHCNSVFVANKTVATIVVDVKALLTRASD